MAGKLPQIAKAIAGIGEFLDKSAAAKKLVDKAEDVIEQVWKKFPSCLTDKKSGPAARSASLSSEDPLEGCKITNEMVDATWMGRDEFPTRNSFGIWAWGGNTKDGALDLRTPSHVAAWKAKAFTRADALVWQLFYEQIHQSAVARHGVGSPKINPSAQHRAELFRYIIKNLGD
ncbi:hypothetical protein ABZ424_28240 [Streptomyces sp. NPDC005790]|uniref:hypothetical protein n=1 Tax=Streptomyces sp. NPDC005790 TaxID=3154777 RepID=UPI0033E751E4